MKKELTFLILILVAGCSKVNTQNRVLTENYYENNGFLVEIIPFAKQFAVFTYPGKINIYKLDQEGKNQQVSSNDFPGFIQSVYKISENEVVILSDGQFFRVDISKLNPQIPLHYVSIKNSDKIQILSSVKALNYVFVLSRRGELYKVNYSKNSLEKIPDFRIYSPVKMLFSDDLFISDKRDFLYRFSLDNHGELKEIDSYPVYIGLDEFVIYKDILVSKHDVNLWFQDLTGKTGKRPQLYKNTGAKDLWLHNDKLLYSVDKTTRIIPVENGLNKEFEPEILSDYSLKCLRDFGDKIIAGFNIDGIKVIDRDSLSIQLINPENGRQLPRWLGKNRGRLLIDTGQEFIWEALENNPDDLVEFYPAMDGAQVNQIQGDHIVYQRDMNYFIAKDLKNQFKDHFLFQYENSSARISPGIGVSDSSLVYGTSNVNRLNKLELCTYSEAEKPFKRSDTFYMGNNAEDIIYDIVQDGNTVYITTLKGLLIFRINNGKLNMMTEYVYPPNFYGARLCYFEDRQLVAVSGENETEYLLFKIKDDFTFDLVNHRKFKSGKRTITLTKDGQYLVSVIPFDRIIVEDITLPNDPKVITEIPIQIVAKNVEMIGNKIYVNYLNGIREFTLERLN